MSVVVYVLSTVTGYVLTSALLLKCPSLLHRRKRETFRSRHISHRGGAGENLENTMAAFRHAVQLGTDMLELDCHLTKDEQVVVLHDDNLKRSTGVSANISDVAYADLPPYLCKLGVTFKRDCFIEGGDDKNIPLLKDVFEAFPQTPINIDIKVNDDTLINKVSELVVKYNREQLTVWGNSSDQIVQKCYKEMQMIRLWTELAGTPTPGETGNCFGGGLITLLILMSRNNFFSEVMASVTLSTCSGTNRMSPLIENPQIPLLFSLPRVLILVGLFYTGLLPFVPLKEQFLEIPMPSITSKLRDPRKMTRSERLIIWLADTLLMKKALFNHLTARGIQVYVWVLNDEEDFKRAFDLGATGVMTDYPTKLKEFLENNISSKSK